MAKYKVTWIETVKERYSTIVEANGSDEAQYLIETDEDAVRTSVIDADSKKVIDWYVIGIGDKI